MAGRGGKACGWEVRDGKGRGAEGRRGVRSEGKGKWEKGESRKRDFIAMVLSIS